MRVKFGGALLRTLLLCTLASSPLLLACQNSDQKQAKVDARQEALSAWGEFALRNYWEFSLRAEGLREGAEDYCKGPSDESLELAKLRYWEAREAWIFNRVFAFGPEVELPLRLGPKIDFQPPRHMEIQEMLDSEEELRVPSRTGAHLRGFPALEYVLFGLPAEGAEPEARTCAYLTGIASDFVELSVSLFEAWSPEGGDFVEELIMPRESGSTFDDAHSAFSAIVNRMGYIVENIRDRDLRDPLGDDADSVQPQLVVSRLSGRSLQDMRDQLAALEMLFFGRQAYRSKSREEGRGGDAGTSKEGGISAYAKSKGKDFDETFLRLLKASREALESLEPSFEKALSEGRDEVQNFDAALRELQVFFQAEIIGSLGLSQIFNDADGD